MVDGSYEQDGCLAHRRRKSCLKRTALNVSVSIKKEIPVLEVENNSSGAQIKILETILVAGQAQRKRTVRKLD